MKSLLKKFTINAIGALAMLGAIVSCSEEVDYDKASEISPNVLLRSIQIKADDEWVELGEEDVLRVGTEVRLEGDNLNQVDKVYFNGYEVQEEFTDISKTYLITTIPDETPVGNEVECEEMRDTVFVVSNVYGENGLRARIISKNFSVSSIYDDKTNLISTAEIGQTIILNGTDLNHIVRIYLNGQELLPESYTIESEYIVRVVIPEDIPVLDLPESNVAIRVVNEFGEEYSYVGFTITGKKPKITAITDADGNAITEVRVNDKVYVYGSEFGNSPKVTLNGVEMETEPSENGDYITFTVSQNVITDGNASNKLIVTTAHGSSEFDLTVVFETPLIDRVSHTLPRAGERIIIYGNNLENASKVVFPGGQEVVIDDLNINTDGTQIEVVVPEGGDETAGALKVVTSSGVEAYSYSYMNCNYGIFIQKFNGDPGHSAGSSTISGNLSADIGSVEDWPKNPSVYRAFPKDATMDYGATSSAADNVNVYYNFIVSKNIRQIIGDGKFQGTESCDDLAVQFDMYMTPDKWTGGGVRFTFDSSNDKDITFIPWHKNYNDVYKEVELDFSHGWKTITIPMKDMETAQNVLNDLTIDDNVKGQFKFLFGNFTYSTSGDYDRGEPMSGFRIYFGNFRIVPYTKPSIEE